MKQRFKVGDRALIVGKHPHVGAQVTLLEYGPYGLEFLQLVGWKVRRLDTGEECYCKSDNLAAESVAVATTEAEPELVEAEELLPTVSPGRRETMLDRLRAHYAAAAQGEELPLTRHQRDVLKRLESLWSMLLEFKTSEHVLGKHMQVFQVSRAQGYRDLADCKSLFGDVVKSSQEADRYLLREMGMLTFSRAKKAGELGEMNKALANLIKITGIEKADPNLPDAEDLLPSTYVLELKGAGNKPLTLNLEKIAELPAHEYEEVMDIIQQSGTSEVDMLRKIMEAARGTVD